MIACEKSYSDFMLANGHNRKMKKHNFVFDSTEQKAVGIPAKVMAV